MKVNANFKDTVFGKLFSDEHVLRELYNALAGTSYDDSAPVVINTLSDVLFMDRKNDISFEIDNKIIVQKALYRTRRKKIARPEFVVLYNGTADYPDYSELKLSESFIEAGYEPPNLELIVKIYNINKGCNPALSKKCGILAGYETFVDKIREFQAPIHHKNTPQLEKAFKNAIQWCIDNYILDDFLLEHSTEVINMLLAEYNLETAIEVAKEEALEASRQALEEKDRAIAEKDRIIAELTQEAHDTPDRGTQNQGSTQK